MEKVNCEICDIELSVEEAYETFHREYLCDEHIDDYNRCDMCHLYTKEELSGETTFGRLCEECQP